MNIGVFVGIVLIASVIFIGFNLVVNDFETSLIDTGIVNTTPFSSNYSTTFNQTEKIQEDFKSIETGLQSLGEEGEWWEKLGDFIGAIPVVIIDFPKVVISTLYNSIGNLKIVLNELGIPIEIVVIATMGLVIWIIFKLVNFWKSGAKI